MSIVEQLAKEFGVSNATVSRALNDKPGVSDDLRGRIMARAQEMQYTPRSIAVVPQSMSIGFFIREKPGIPAQTDPFYAEILHSVEQSASRTDYHVSIATLTDDILNRPGDFRFVRDRRIDAMILAGPDIPARFITAMLQTSLPVVLVDNKLDFSPTHCVNSDDEGGAYQAASFLLENGHTRIGVLSGPGTWSSSARRIRGYSRALLDVGLEPVVVQMDRTTTNSGDDAFRQLFAGHPTITAVCAVNDSMAIGAVRAASALGCHVPDDISVIGFDDIAWAAINNPPLTTIHIPKTQMGKEAALRVLALLNDPELLPSEIVVPVQLIERASTAPVRM